MKYDYLIVGAGFAGSVIAERIATQLHKRILIIDRRDHIGGNSYDYRNGLGITIHKYGPHIFHTNSKKVWEYISQFTDWRYYFHKVLAMIDGELVTIPFNFNSLYQLFPPNYAKKIEKKLLENYQFGLKIPIFKLLQSKDNDLKFLADYIYKNVFLGYNLKQWGITPDELDPSVANRVPILLNRDNRYFQDQYQGIPLEGYAKIFERLLDNPNIELKLNTDFKNIINEIEYDNLIYTGAIDEFFDYEFGELPYRSLRFVFKNLEIEQYQPIALINYPNNYDFTRISEYKHFLNEKSISTTISMEYPEPFEIGKNERYYPIPKEDNNQIYEKYTHKAKTLQKNVRFIGRLAEYKYYNMDQVIGVALLEFEKIKREIKI
ncbi:MAG TPA: UDP-galactopyranose mutase [Bacteroidetes bacterium]|nr:UDP-galactopyranose mutase [Bacteroidota bacterium]